MRLCSPSLAVSTPHSTCLATTSCTASRTALSSSAWSTALPWWRSSTRFRRRSGLGRLPVCVVRMRAPLRFMACCLLGGGDRPAGDLLLGHAHPLALHLSKGKGAQLLRGAHPAGRDFLVGVEQLLVDSVALLHHLGDVDVL